jgi:hypothetical protein
MKIFEQRHRDWLAVIESLHSSFNELSQNYTEGWATGDVDFY